MNYNASGYDDFGNFNYGATGTALGVSSNALLFGAGVAKNVNYWPKGKGNPHSKQPPWNDPHKMDLIRQGILLHKTVVKDKQRNHGATISGY